MSKETKKTTYEAIITAARKLFIENGYDNVSMRDVAAELSISVGNLTYHFKKKEDLLEAVVMDFSSRYSPHSVCTTLEELDDLLKFFEQLEEENLFYFSNYTKMSRMSGQIREIQRRVFMDNTVLWEDSLKKLNEAGLVQPEEFREQYAETGNTLHFMKIYWHQREESQRQMGVPISNFRQSAWGILFMLLTEKGKEFYFKNVEKEKLS
ncbi:MAG: helix-turn-helix domain-containing protein [Lacrimispora sp.]|uniref:TetR/AcrR family transcriptional regulator n=1 Tax=Lacrimispora sp. TaxID=2719234 RepID=UPI0039E5B397